MYEYGYFKILNHFLELTNDKVCQVNSYDKHRGRRGRGLVVDGLTTTGDDHR
jgi:hypothetical protein